MLTEKQEKFLERMEQKEIRYGFSRMSDYSVTCTECGESKRLHTTGAIQAFSSLHRDCDANIDIEYMGAR